MIQYLRTLTLCLGLLAILYPAAGQNPSPTVETSAGAPSELRLLFTGTLAGDPVLKKSLDLLEANRPKEVSVLRTDAADEATAKKAMEISQALGIGKEPKCLLIDAANHVLAEIPLGALTDQEAKQVLQKQFDAGVAAQAIESTLPNLAEDDRRTRLVQLIRLLGLDVIAAYRTDLISQLRRSNPSADEQARALVKELEENEGKAEFNRLFDELFPQLAEAAKSTTDDETIAVIDKALESKRLSPYAAQRVHLQKFRIFINARKYEQAFQALDHALQACPDSKLAAKIPGLKERAKKGELAAKNSPPKKEEPSKKEEPAKQEPEKTTPQ